MLQHTPLFHRAAFAILAAQQAFFHNKPPDSVYVTTRGQNLGRSSRGSLSNAHEDAVHRLERRNERCRHVHHCQVCLRSNMDFRRQNGPPALNMPPWVPLQVWARWASLAA